MYEFWFKFHWYLFLKVQFNNIPALVQIMAWLQPGNEPLSEPMMIRLSTHIYESLRLNELNVMVINAFWCHWKKYNFYYFTTLLSMFQIQMFFLTEKMFIIVILICYTSLYMCVLFCISGEISSTGKPKGFTVFNTLKPWQNGWHFQMHLFEWECLIFNKNFSEVSPQGSDGQ